MFKWLHKLIRRRPIVARYDAAATNADNRRYWANADSLSPNAANSLEVRRTLRNRARYEAANNCYANGIVRTLANDIVGTGPRLQIQSGDREINTIVERRFDDWARSVRLAEKLRTMCMAKVQDGEAFMLLTSRPVASPKPTLYPQLIEADRVTTPDAPLDQIVDGIILDEYGEPVAYHILRKHPGDASFSANVEYDVVPADSVIHWFRASRPEQARGVSEMAPALPLFAQFRRYNLAVLAAAETAAEIAGVLYTDAPAGGEADETPPYEPVELERRALLTMPSGWRMEQVRAEQPTANHDALLRQQLNEIARCFDMPYNIAAGNSSGYNYASGRLDHQTYFRTLRVSQSHLELVVLDRLLGAWYDEGALIPGYFPASLPPLTDWEVQWFWEGREHVDPLKEAEAQSRRLANHTTTYADEYARRGLDWEQQLRQRAKEVALMAELGLGVPENSQARGDFDEGE